MAWMAAIGGVVASAFGATAISAGMAAEFPNTRKRRSGTALEGPDFKSLVNAAPPYAPKLKRLFWPLLACESTAGMTLWLRAAEKQRDETNAARERFEEPDPD